MPASALELEVSLQDLPPSCCIVQEAEPSTPPMLPCLSARGGGGGRQFHLPPASSFRYTLCQPMIALWENQVEQSPALGVKKTVLPESQPPGTCVLLGGSCIFLCLSCFQSSEGCCGHYWACSWPCEVRCVMHLWGYASVWSQLSQLGTRAWQVENQSWADTLELRNLKEVLTDQEAQHDGRTPG